MHVISYKAIREFVAMPEHMSAKVSLDVWHKAARKAQWAKLVDVRQEFPHADAVGRYTVFNIKGNYYRLIAEINYSYEKEVGSPRSEVRGHYDRALGTHAGFSCVVLMPRIMATHLTRFISLCSERADKQVVKSNVV